MRTERIIEAVLTKKMELINITDEQVLVAVEKLNH